MTQTIIVDINTRGPNPIAYTHQGDTGRTFVVYLYENGEEFSSLSSYTAKVAAVVPSDTGYYVITGDEMVTPFISDNRLVIDLTERYTARSGRGFLTIILTSTNASAATLRPINIDLEIQKSADGEDVIAGASDFPQPLANIPQPPTTDGTYTLQATVSDGEIIYTWES